MSTDGPTTEPAATQPAAADVPGDRYEIRVQGHLGSRWAAWFDGLSLAKEDDATTVISGPIVDQAALHGLLQKLRDLGITLLSLTRTAPDGSGDAIEHPAFPQSPNQPTSPGAPQ